MNKSHLLGPLCACAITSILISAYTQSVRSQVTWEPKLEAASIQASIAGSVRDCVMITCSRDGIPDDTFTNVTSVLSTANNPATGFGGGEDQGIVEVDLSSLAKPVNSAILELNVFTSKLFPFDIDVYAYSGDESLTLDDWNQGVLVTTFTYNGEVSVKIDLTKSVNEAILTGTTVLGVNLRYVGVSPIFLNGPFVAFDTADTPSTPPELPTPPMLLVNTEPAPSMSISIDIHPHNARNIVNPRGNGGIWVALLSNIDLEFPFDPSSQVDIPTVEFGRAGAKAICHNVKDINNDGIGDLLLRFKIPETGIACDDTAVTLAGETFEGQSFTGKDFINTVGCKNINNDKKNKHE